MTQKDFIENLFGAGQGIKDAIGGGSLPTSASGWMNLVLNEKVKGHLSALANTLSAEDFDDAIKAVQVKHDELRAAKPLVDMTSEEVAACLTLSDLAQVLRAQNVYVAVKQNPLQWVGENIVPLASDLAKFAMPALMAL